MHNRATQYSLKNSWRILFKYLFEHKNKVIMLSAVGVISAIANGTIPYITGRFFDAILIPEEVFVGTQFEMHSWLFLIIIFGVALLTANITDWRNEVNRKEIGFNVYTTYLSKSWGHLMKLPKSFFASRKIGGVTDSFERSACVLETIISDIVIDLSPQFLSLFIGLAVVFYIHPVFGFILLVGIFSYIIILMKIIPRTINLSRVERKLWRTIWGDSFDSVLNLDTIKKFTAENSEYEKIYKGFKKATDMSVELATHWGGVSFYQRLIVSLTQVIFFVISVYLINNEVITIGELIALNGYAMMTFIPFMTLGRNWQQIQNGLVIIGEAEDILNTPEENYYPENAVKLDKIRGDVEFKNVSFYYDKSDGDILKDINLKVNTGETVALVGESGVGKSTLIELISAYYFPQRGEVLIDGVDIKKINLTFLRKNIATVPQEVSLFNDTIEANIRYGNLEATSEEVKKAVKNAHADEFIDKFPKKYKQIVGERGVKLSVGQKQRVAIARAILRDPKILILDEPTSALDSVTEKYITESLKKLMQGRTTFIVAHRLSTIREVDKIIVFEKGKIIEVGKHEELMKIENGIYRKLYNLYIGSKEKIFRDIS